MPKQSRALQEGLDPKTVEAHCRRTLETISPILRKLVPGVKREEVECAEVLRRGAGD